MEISHILEDLAYDEGILPREAIEAAIVKHAQITPYLLQILEDATERVPELINDGSYQGHLYAMYLLAQFRETRALPLIIKLFSYSDDTPHAIAGDVLTEDLSRILASVCDDESLIKELIESPGINPYVKAAGISSLVHLVGIKKISREATIRYFGELLNYRLEKSRSFAWDSLIAAICALYPGELFYPISKAFNAGLVDITFISMEDVINIINEETIESCLQELLSSPELINDTLEEMEKWLEDFPIEP
ncbi:hypothetical protein CYD57_0617 [Chlamydia psittaci]|uniref:DUF1186 domain-containing protein n=3 Tax=Chlamydia/Chlamydophila group TaxID=1113537 RepID=A0ABP2X214_CHLPS|nr:conserved hypothetical protein [Chlamydia psittaci 6BC]AEG85642.1 conserved hypothetical protein [Chlamydia psittaci C19/98]AEG86620.1 conserved hypothetical protein [Chlamydia psittaci 01DC11]AEG87595.1 conserved hypothetical protein [Chlamydia psittaci 02DC15]AEG88571.1 conserved hypothetical protein [Chlamydia psittaci 08DC60]AFS19661.1 hypothetical protein B595_0699 [Chlamydia psittaci 84/55]AFS20729.1 hypothetical protein B598_0648 [Chlamydia psittaci GR9]AFS21272.1 hypothetical prot